MSQLLLLDALYPEMEEATIGRWLVSVGQAIAPGQPIVELITDKVAYEYQSTEAGIMLAILPPAKSVIPVGTVLAILGEAGEQAANLAALEADNRRLAAAREASLAAVHEATGSPTDAAAVAAPQRQGVRATPAARRLARERGVNLADVQGSGPEGMITVEDIPG